MRICNAHHRLLTRISVPQKPVRKQVPYRYNEMQRRAHQGRWATQPWNWAGRTPTGVGVPMRTRRARRDLALVLSQTGLVDALATQVIREHIG